MRGFLTFSLLTLLLINTFGQVTEDSIWFDTTYYHKVRPGFLDAEYFGFHGYFITSGEIYSVNKNFFRELLNTPETPYVELEQGGYLGWMGLTRNNLFLSLSYASAFAKPAKNDSLATESKLNQNSWALRCGYNLIKGETFVMSPYIGIRQSRFRHLTRSQNKRTPIDEYLLEPNIDLRVTQYSAIAGLNFTLNFNDQWSFGGYLELLGDLHEHPITRTKGSRLSSNISNPLNNYVIGIGMGFGFTDDNRQMHNKR